MSIVTGCRGLCLKFEGEVRLIHGIGGNPFVYIVKRQGGYYDPDHERWVSV